MKNTLTKIVNTYVLVMLVVFPLLIVHQYYDIQDVKLYLYLYSTIACTVLVLLTAVVYAVKDPGERARLKELLSPKALRRNLKAADVFALLYLVIVIASTFLSTWVYEAFWGNAARGQGAFLLIWYVVTYFLVSKLYVPKRMHMDLMLFGGLIVCGWGILDYFGMSPLDIPDIVPFSSTFGNVNILTAVEAMYLIAASVMFIGEQGDNKVSRVRSVYYFFLIPVMFVALECGRSANILLSIMFAVCFLPFYAFRNRSGIVKYLIVLALYLLAMEIVAWATFTFPDMACEYPGELARMANAHTRQIAILLAMVIAAAAILFFIFAAAEKKLSAENKIKDEYGIAPVDRKISRVLRVIWAAAGVLAFAAVVFIFYDANTGGHPDLYAPVRSFVIFDEKWGTDRGYVWRLAAKYYGDFSLKNKLIGSGPETFGIYVLINDLNHSLRKLDLSYDAVHNVWFQNLFELGILGFIGYYGMTAAACAEGLRKNSGVIKSTAAAFAFAVMVYTFQSFVNISVVLTTPFVFVCMGAAAAAGRVESKKAETISE